MTATRASEASAALTRALVNTAARGIRPHCSDPGLHDYWLSESKAERKVAVVLCGACPVLEPCRTAAEANAERFGVFGGKDFTILAGRARQAS
jgi:Transcription factor WhiB